MRPLAELRTERLLLRPWRDDDIPPFAEMNADPRVMEHMPARQSLEDTLASVARIRAHFDAAGFGLWAVEVPAVAPFIGFVGLQSPLFEAHFTPCIEVGWRLAAAHWGKGYATEGARAALAHGFGERGLAEIVSMTVSANARSWRVMERIGMTRSPGDDFDHPRLAEGHPLRRHVLYRMTRAAWQAKAAH